MAVEGVGEGKSVVVSYGIGDGGDFFIGGEKESRSLAHAKVGEVFDWTSVELFLIEASEMLATHVGKICERIERPISSKVLASSLPDAPQAFIEIAERVEADDVTIDQFDPVVLIVL